MVPSLLVAQDGEFGPNTLDGDWALRESGDEDVKGFMTMSGGTLTVVDPESGGTEVTLLYVSNEGPLYLYNATISGKLINLHAYVQSPSRALFWADEDDDLIEARRLGELSPEFFGEWEAVMADGDAADFRKVVIEAGFITLYAGVSEFRTPLYAMADDGRELELAFSRDGRDGLEAYLVQPVTEHACLVWEAGDDDLIIIYRVGHRPAWAPEPAEVPQEGSTTTVQPPR